MTEKVICVEREKTISKVVEMTEPGHLEMFKKAFDDAVVYLGIPLVRSTVEVGGHEWAELLEIKVIRDQDVAAARGEGEKDAPRDKTLTSETLMVLGLTPQEERKRNPMKRFFEVRTHVFESSTDWKYRVVLWEWMKACLKGTRPNYTGKWFSLTKTVSEFDVARLYKMLVQQIEIPNIVSHGVLVREFMDMRPGQNEDVFLFLTRLDEVVDRVERINHVCPTGLQISIPLWQQRWKIVEVTCGLPMFRSFYDRLLNESPDKWSMITKEKLIEGLRVSAHNRQVLQPMKGPGGQGGQERQSSDITVNLAYTKPTSLPGGRPKPNFQRGGGGNGSQNANGQGAHATQTQGQPGGAQNGNRQTHRPSRKLCWSFQDHGKCEKANCPFVHEKEEGGGGQERKFSAERRPQGGSGPPQTKQGEGPQARKFSPRRQLTPAAPRQLVGLQPTMERGANVIQVFRLKEGESGEHMAMSEGEEESMSGAPQDQSGSGGVSPNSRQAEINSLETEGCVVAILDSGANESVFRATENSLADKSVEVSVQTAKKGSTITRMREGEMDMKFDDGREAKLGSFLYTDMVRHNLLSVGKLCDAGYCVVFNNDGFIVYDVVTKERVHGGARNKSGLYSICLSRPARPLLRAREESAKKKIKQSTRDDPAIITNFVKSTSFFSTQNAQKLDEIDNFTHAAKAPAAEACETPRSAAQFHYAQAAANSKSDLQRGKGDQIPPSGNQKRPISQCSGGGGGTGIVFVPAVDAAYMQANPGVARGDPLLPTQVADLNHMAARRGKKLAREAKF